MNNYNPPCQARGPGQGKYGTYQTGVQIRENNNTSCACKKAPFPVNTSLAMAYVPFQQSGEVYTCERALSRGTLFPCLDKPFLMGCCK